MKIYIKPIVEVKEFNVTNSLANLNDFLSGSDAPGAGTADVITAANITSYSTIS